MGNLQLKYMSNFQVKKYRRMLAKRWRKNQKRKGLCVSCSEVASKGKVLCEKCSAIRRQFRNDCIQNKLCVTCAKPNDSGRQRCVLCANKYRFRHLKKDGVSKEEVQKATVALKKFKGICDSCGDKIPKGKEKIDHNHKTKKFRGIICHGCNVAIGFLSENPERLERAASYVRKRND